MTTGCAAPRRARGLGLWVAAMLLAACGGGGDTGTPEDPDPSANSSTFTGAVRITQRITTHFVGQTYGPARLALNLNLDVCNGWRDSVYQLPPNQPDEAVLARLDVIEHKRVLDPDAQRARLDARVVNVRITDLQRWLDELKAIVDAGGTDYPANPPNCALHELTEHDTSVVWRDAVRHEINHTSRKIVGVRKSADFAPAASDFALQRRTTDKGSFLGEACTWSRSLAGDPSSAQLCHWDRYPFQAYLSWPWLLDGVVNGAGQEVKTELVGVDDPTIVSPGEFDLPTGYDMVFIDAP